MKKIRFVILALFVIMAGAASLSAALTFSPLSPRTGETVTFTLSPSGAPVGAISWNFGDGSPVQSGTALTITHAYAAIGSYTASATYFTGMNSAIPSVDQAAVTVIDPRQVTFSPLQPKAGQAVVFTAQNFFSTCIRWDFGDGMMKNGAANESHAYAGAGTYTVHAYEDCGGTYGASAAVTVAAANVEPPPPTAPSFAVTFASLYFAGGKTDVSVAKDSSPLQAFADVKVTGTGILQWQWLVDGMAIKADTLSVSFSNKYTLDSGQVPGLPTSIPGRHQVTLRFQNPKTDFAIPAVTYFVALKGPAPVVSRVTPSTLAPGKEYALELEGSGFTPGTEIAFPVPLAPVKKTAILSSTRAQATVFVPPTAGNGTKAVGAWNEYGKSSGPGQVTIASPVLQPAPGLSPIKGIPKIPPKELGNKLPVITGSISCNPMYQSRTKVDYYARAKIYLKRGSQPISGAIVKLDEAIIPEVAGTPGYYRGYSLKQVQVGREFKVEVTINGVTHARSGGRVDNFFAIIKPVWRDTLFYKQCSQFDCQWTFSNGVSKVNLLAKHCAVGGGGISVLFDQDLTADHASIPTAAITDPNGSVELTLTRKYSDITFEGLFAPGSIIGVSLYAECKVNLSDAPFEKVPSSELSAPPTTGAKPNPPLQANVPEPPNPAPPAVFCTDIAVTGMKATLVSTQLGDTSVDIPHDKVRIEVVLENLGNKAVPSDFLMDIFIKKNGEQIVGRGYPIFTTSLGAPGSRFVIGDIVDSFPHGVATTYSIEILPLNNECSIANNQASLTIDEAILHPKAKQVPDQGRDKAILRSSELPNIPVEPLPAPQPPFVITTETLTVTGKTPPPVPTGPFPPVAVTTEALTVTGKTVTPPPSTPFTPVSVTTETLMVTGKK